ncbi:hypothetical protein Xoosp13_25 [Xanthomonas phage Xoo-sp13]|nr:hypothetical protein Xoosp13_25 [Xanthomonas phage Xoo-sp13]
MFIPFADVSVQFPSVPIKDGPEPTIRQMVVHYYRQAMSQAEAEALAEEYLTRLQTIVAENAGSF